MKIAFPAVVLTISAASLATLGGCSTAERPYGQATGADNQMLTTAGDPPGQCSRQSFAKGEKYFVPSVGDVKSFEATLEKGLKSGTLFGEDYFLAIGKRARILGGESASAPPLKLTLQLNWNRSYMGIVRDGRRVIAGDFEPTYGDPKARVQRGAWGPEIVCDGGPAFFGAEFDPTDGKITTIGFNGEA
ncbi:hypothetical protein [Sphingopyxis fribergensis]